MPYSLIVQYPYETIQIAICKNGNILRTATLHKFEATAQTIPTLQELLNSQNLKLSDISFFGINIGPGPYNTLRAILTMINAIHRVSQIPLIAMSALDLLQEDIKRQNTLIILNAFENHVFYKIETESNSQSGACNINTLQNILSKEEKSFLIQGNGALKYEKQLKTWSNIAWPKEIIPFNKLETLAYLSFQKFKNHEYTDQCLKPIYFEDLSQISYKS
jgi:tRNA threonylcarbamoyl adenosine modification protein YeaZ